MLACGTICQPTRINREIRVFQSSASPIQVDTDKGMGFVKAQNNPTYKEQVVIAELVAAELGTWFGLKIPPFAVIDHCNIELLMKDGQPMNGPLFFSSFADGETYDGGNTFLSKLRDKDDITRLVVFDTWVRNWDRHGLGDENKDNLLFVRDKRKYDLVPIDHSWAFDGDFPVTPSSDVIEDTKVYGKFPAFDQYVTSKTLSIVLERLAALDRCFVKEIVNSVPLEWGLGTFASVALVELICSRANFVVNTIAARLVDDPPIPGLHRDV